MKYKFKFPFNFNKEGNLNILHNFFTQTMISTMKEMMQLILMQCSVVQYTAVYCIILQFITLQYSAVQYGAERLMQCIAIQATVKRCSDDYFVIAATFPTRRGIHNSNNAGITLAPTEGFTNCLPR